MKVPVRLTAHRDHRGPGAFSTGRLSPVSIDSSTLEAPADHQAVHRDPLTRAHARTSPSTTSAIGTSRSPPAGAADRLQGHARRRIASEVPPRARASSQRPSTRNVISRTEASKYGMAPAAMNAWARGSTATLKK